ncbi:DUF2752 domain-containing protein [Gordonia sp. PKS22-38]|uniref:DUF2752 domain-containing protein n=1 Tax=Gordonia prachuapensis TaxID=3115651 RepID=A0ABU7MPX5_9ACTN|nr:DUF2752 domain-containing protein [Gordonia sp. PKS22-38]
MTVDRRSADSSASSTTGQRRIDAGARVTAAGLGTVGLAALATTVVVQPEVVADGPELCPFARMTGLPCPACGLTRSWVALGHGDLEATVSFNVFGPVFMVLAIVVTAVALWSAATGAHGLDRVRAVLTSRPMLIVVGLWAGYGLVRLADAGFGWGWFPAIT